MENRLITAKELAKMWEVTESRIYALAREELIPHVRLGRQIRFSTGQLDLWIQKGGQTYPGGWKRHNET